MNRNEYVSLLLSLISGWKRTIDLLGEEDDHEAMELDSLIRKTEQFLQDEFGVKKI